MMNLEVLAFALYLILVVVVGVVFYMKGRKSGGEKDYFLGGRKMNGWVAALSAGASDMSAWVLMGLPGSIYLYGLGQVWIAVGLWIGTILAWVLVAPRLRRYSIRAKDSITIPQFLTNRFLAERKTLQIVCAVVFIVVYTVYAASSIVACGKLFNTVLGMDSTVAMVGATAVIMIYTLLGGFNAVCWTDFFQGMMMLGALLLAPIIAVLVMSLGDYTAPAKVLGENYYNVLSTGTFNWGSVADILSGLGWGLGYFGMPHILVRYMSIRSEKEMKKSRVVGIFWTSLILVASCFVALVGREFLGDSLVGSGTQDMVFINMVRRLFIPLISGILLSAILAASMSTADSQLLLSSSAFASDIYKPIFRKKASEKEMMWAGRAVVAVISVVALLIAMNPACSSIMALVECAWGAFGAAFGPVILLALFWKRFTYKGAIAGIVTGFLADAAWYMLLGSNMFNTTVFDTGIYEIIPGFIAGMIAAVLVSLCGKAPAEDVVALFEEAQAPTE